MKSRRIQLQLVDENTGAVVEAGISVHTARLLLKQLNELFGDAQSGARPGELITVPPIMLGRAN